MAGGRWLTDPYANRPEEHDGHFEQRPRHSSRPSLGEVQAAHRRHEVDAIWGQAELDHLIGCTEVRLADPQRLQGRAGRGEGPPDAGAVVRRQLHPEVEVPGGPGNPVDREGVRAHDQKAHLLGDEGRRSRAAGVIRQRDRASPASALPRGTTRAVMCERSMEEEGNAVQSSIATTSMVDEVDSSS
jgi:hypothetical protein